MNFRDLISNASNNLWRNKVRTLLTIIAIFIGGFTISLTSAINVGVNDYIDRQLGIFNSEEPILEVSAQTDSLGMMSNSGEPTEYDPDSSSTAIAGMSYSTINQSDIDEISRIEGIVEVTGWQMSTIEYVQGVNERQFNLSAQAMSEGMVPDVKDGSPIELSADDYQINLPTGYAEALGYGSDEQAVGETLDIFIANQATGEIESVQAEIVGILNRSLVQDMMGFYNQSLQARLHEVQTAGLPDAIANNFLAALARFESDADLDQIKSDLNERGYTGSTAEDQIGAVRDVVNAITGALVVFGAIALLAASFGIINTLYMSVQERTREIGLFKAMGMSSGKIFAMFSFEAALIGFWGSVIGYGSAMLVGHYFNNFASETFLSGLEGFELTKFEPMMGVTVCLIIMLIAFLAGTLPSRRAAKQDPIDALRYE